MLMISKTHGTGRAKIHRITDIVRHLRLRSDDHLMLELVMHASGLSIFLQHIFEPGILIVETLLKEL
jgi:hypothetical protein